MENFDGLAITRKLAKRSNFSEQMAHTGENACLHQLRQDIIPAKMPCTRILGSILTLGVVLSHCAAAQSATSVAAEPRVSVAFFANDNHGEPVAAITQSDVIVLDNKNAPQVILGLKSRTDLPLRMGRIIDSSKSEGKSGLYQPTVQAAIDFLNKVLVTTEDQVFIEKFDVLPESTDFVSKQQFSGIKLNLAPEGGTALYDALRFACDQRIKGGPSHDFFRVILLLSDGGDNASRNTRNDAIASALRAGVVNVFAVSTDENSYGAGGEWAR